MLNTRSFIKSLLVAAIAPTILIPRAKDSFKWKQNVETGLYVLNPDYVNAPFEIAYIIGEDNQLSPYNFRRDAAAKEFFWHNLGEKFEVDYPTRLTEFGKRIPPFIKQKTQEEKNLIRYSILYDNPLKTI